MSRRSPRAPFAALVGLALAVFTTGMNAPARGQDLNQLDRQYGDARKAGRYPEAERIARRGIEVATALRKETTVARWWDNLGLVLVDQGREADAELPYRRALAVFEKAGASERLNLAIVLIHLGYVYEELARYAEAEPLYKRALAIRQGALGVDHPRLAGVLDSLANLYTAQGRYDEAVSLYKRELAIEEKAKGPDHPDVAGTLHNLAICYLKQDRYAEAEPLIKRAMTITEASEGADSPHAMSSLEVLGNLYNDQGRYAEAERAHRRVLEAREKALGPDHFDVAGSLHNLANVEVRQWRYAEAEPLYKRALAIMEKTKGPDHLDVADCLHDLATLYVDLNSYPEAERLVGRVLAIRMKALGPDHPAVAGTYNELAGLYSHQGRFAEAESSYKRAILILDKALGAENPALLGCVHNLAILYEQLGRYSEAEPLLRRVLALQEKALGPDHPTTASNLNSLANLYSNQGRYAEAENLIKRAISIKEAAFGPDHPALAMSLHNLARVDSERGRYAEAESLNKRALAIQEKALGPDHLDVAGTLNNLGSVYDRQGRAAEAEPLFRRVLSIREKVLNPDHPDVALAVHNLACSVTDPGRRAEAERLHLRALAALEKAFGPDHPEVARAASTLAYFYAGSNRDDEAERLFRRTLSIRMKALGPDHPDVADALISLSTHCYQHGKGEEARALLDRAFAILDRPDVDPVLLIGPFLARARIARDEGRREDALAALGRALDLFEQQRARISGAEQERAAYQGRNAVGYETLATWLVELGRAAEAFDVMERARARTLVEQQDTRGVDLLAGLPAAQADALRSQEAAARARVAAVETQLDALDCFKGISDEERRARGQALRAELAEARQRYVDAYRDLRNASPACRLAVGKDRRPVPLADLKAWLGECGGLLLEYQIGMGASHVAVVAPGGSAPRVEPLTLDESQARALGVEPGPLTADRLHLALAGDGTTGVLPRISDPRRGAEATPVLAALWEVLVPAPERKLLRSGGCRVVFVVPDGELALLPFEALVVVPGADPNYALDVAPPFAYGPSASVLYNLARRPGSASVAGREAVLSVGDPAYPDEGSGPVVDRGALALLTPRSRYGAARGMLGRLPFTGWEVEWVAKAFRDRGVAAVRLLGEKATEAGVRYWSPGRKVLHLACHGLADQAFGNVFGALALVPGPKGAADPADDGFLTLLEVYELDLKGCELAVLSACQTNFGPSQAGEGTWAISRGFLVAGSRRVVASDWLVDDEAAASLVSVFCTGLARAQGGGGPADYAAALRAAKRWARGQEKWKAPYYWASLVLVGPP